MDVAFGFVIFATATAHSFINALLFNTFYSVFFWFHFIINLNRIHCGFEQNDAVFQHHSNLNLLKDSKLHIKYVNIFICVCVSVFDMYMWLVFVVHFQLFHPMGSIALYRTLFIRFNFGWLDFEYTDSPTSKFYTMHHMVEPFLLCLWKIRIHIRITPRIVSWFQYIDFKLVIPIEFSNS